MKLNVGFIVVYYVNDSESGKKNSNIKFADTIYDRKLTATDEDQLKG